MTINVNEARELEVTKFYSGLVLISDDKEKFGICLRDSGFEFKYNNICYSAKEGKLVPLREDKNPKYSDTQEELTANP